MLKEEFKNKSVDFSFVTEGWNSKLGRWGTNSEPIKAGAAETRRWVKGREEEVVVVVTHGGFVHFLTEDWGECEKFDGELVRIL